MFYAFSRKNEVFYKISGIDRYLSSCKEYLVKKAKNCFPDFSMRVNAGYLFGWESHMLAFLQKSSAVDLSVSQAVCISPQ